MLFPVRSLMDCVRNEPGVEPLVRHALDSLAQDLNTNLIDYEVRFVHRDGRDFLEFVPEEGNDNGQVSQSAS